MPVTDELPSSLRGFEEDLRGAVMRDLRRQPRRRAVRGAATVACLGAAAAGLMVASPWEGGPTVVERAAAAIAPRDDAVIHRVMVSTRTRADGSVVRRERYETWEYGTGADLHYRGIGTGPRGTIEQSRTPADGPSPAYWDELNVTTGVGVRERASGGLQTITENIRENFENGDWKVVGHTTIDGRRVTHLGSENFYFPATDDCIQDNLYIDPATFEPVVSATEYCAPKRRNSIPTDETRWLSAERLPPTTANIALTSIVAQHPEIELLDKNTVDPSRWPVPPGQG